MNGMKNIAEHGKKPLDSQVKPVFFPLREKLSNFIPAKQKETAFSTMVDRMGKRNAEVNSTPFPNPEKATDR